MNILICHSQAAFRASLKECLQGAFKRQRAKVDEAADEAEVTRKINQSNGHGYDFLIVSLDLAANSDTPMDHARRGISIVRKVNESRKATRCLILVPSEVPAEVAQQLTNLSSLVVTERMEMLEDIISALRSALSKTKVRPCLSLKLVQDPNSSNWTFWLDGGGYEFQGKKGAFLIQPVLIDKLVKRSKAIPEADDWLTALGDIGQELYAHFFDQENDFSKLFRKAVENVGGIESVRFSFDIRQDNYSLAIEALVPYQLGNDGKVLASEKPTLATKLPFWMLHAPIYRSVSQLASCTLGEETRPGLFAGEHGPINCLIIEADASGKAVIPGIKECVHFDRLLNVGDECKKLEAQLLENKKRWGIGVVERISPSGSRLPFKKRLFELLASREWHIVHFAGHSYYRPGQNGKPGNGYLLLPGKQAEGLNAHDFARRLGNTQFLFLSSCHSSEEAFAFEMAKNHVPAVLGFRWGVDDLFVPPFVRSFYERLFSSRSIESAFVEARKKVRQKFGVKNQIWAAPMLVLMHPERGNLPAPLSRAAGAAA